MSDIKVGQIWKEVDPRIDRYLRILSEVGDVITVETVIKSSDGHWYNPPWAKRQSRCKRSRFNNKRSGYVLHEASGT
jgi:hypothetical protein